MRFAIKNTASKAEKEGDVFLRYTGTAEPFRRVSERDCKKIGVDGAGNPKLTFTTGLDEKQVKFFRWYTVKEQEEIMKQIKDLKPIIVDAYGGEDVVSDTNRYFWGEDRNVNRLSVSNEDMDIFYDTKAPAHALLYLSIVSGAFIEMVAPTREWAENNQIPHYLALETEETIEEEDEITRSDAHSALSRIRKEDSYDALFILAWCIQYDTQSYGAYLRSTPVKDLVNYHIKYIDGKLVTKRKKNTPKIFIDYVEKWESPVLNPKLYAEAYVKAGEYYNFINQKEKKYVTAEGTVLGNTIDEAVTNLMKPKFTSDLEILRDKVESKWKE